MNPKFVLVLHWLLNLVLLVAALGCFYLSFFGVSSVLITVTDRIMTAVVGIGFSMLCYVFTVSTIKGGT